MKGPPQAREGDWAQLDEVATISAEDERRLRERCKTVGDRIKRDLGLRQNPLSINVVDGRAFFRASGVAGTLELSPRLTLQIEPKFASASGDAPVWQETLLTILERTRRRHYTYVRSRRLELRPAVFLDHMALAFADAVRAAVDRDPIRVYRVQEETSPFLRGQFAVERQVASLLNRPDRIHCNVDYLDTDNEYNHLLRWAGRRFGGSVRDAQVRRDVAIAVELLPSIEGPPRVPNRLPLRPPAQYEHFGEALEIASTLARGLAHSGGAGRTTGYGYLLNMERVFERFLEVSIQYAANHLGGEFKAVAQQTRRYAKVLTPNVNSYYTRPDNVIYREDNPILLVDAKYKRLEDAEETGLKRPNNGDVYQLFASMAAHGSTRGLLVYPTLGIVSTADRMQIWRVPANGDAFVGAVTVDVSALTSRAALVEFDRRLADRILEFLEATHEPSPAEPHSLRNR